MRVVPLYQVDAFTDRAFGGNPAAVVVLDQPADKAWMQAVAQELNLSETAFVVACDDGDGHWDLRWFTPVVEVPLCGHATLATAHVLWETGRADPRHPLRFATRSGELTASPLDGHIRLDLPAGATKPADAPPELAKALGTTPVATARVVPGVLEAGTWLVEVADADIVAGLDPDLPALEATGATAVIVTAPGGPDGVDFSSRFFAPGLGIDEDPVTGAAHCVLGPYWAARLGRPELRAAQRSARGGRLGVTVLGERVALSGQAVTVLRGELLA